MFSIWTSLKICNELNGIILTLSQTNCGRTTPPQYPVRPSAMESKKDCERRSKWV